MDQFSNSLFSSLPHNWHFHTKKKPKIISQNCERGTGKALTRRGQNRMKNEHFIVICFDWQNATSPSIVMYFSIGFSIF